MAHHCPIATVRSVKRRHKGHLQLQYISPKLVFGFFHPFSVIIFTATVSYIVTANSTVFKYSLQVMNVESAAHRLSCYCRGQKNEHFSISTFPPKIYEQLFRKCPQSINKWDNGEGTSMSPPPTGLKSISRSDLVASFVTLKHFRDLLPLLTSCVMQRHIISALMIPQLSVELLTPCWHGWCCTSEVSLLMCGLGCWLLCFKRLVHVPFPKS